MTYKFTRDFPPTNWKKGDVLPELHLNYDTALLLATGIIEETRVCEKNCPDFHGQEILHKEQCDCSCHSEVKEPEWPVELVMSPLTDECFYVRIILPIDCPRSAAEAARDRITKLIKEGK